jgi:hypothetical protein
MSSANRYSIGSTDPTGRTVYQEVFLPNVERKAPGLESGHVEMVIGSNYSDLVKSPMMFESECSGQRKQTERS